MKMLIPLALLAATVLFAAEEPRPEVKVVTEKMHGVDISDPYRWLEGSDAPELKGKPDAELDKRVSEWTDEQNARTRKVLEAFPQRKALELRLRELMQIGTISAPDARGQRYFYLKREGAQAQQVLFVQDGLKGSPRLLLDPNQLDPTGLTAPSFAEPDPSGKLVAFGLYRAGDENTTLYVLDVESGEWLADELPGKVDSPYWTPDSRGIFYGRLADVENPYSGQVVYHKLGTHHRHDKVLFEQYKEGPLASTWGPFAYVSRDARWMILGYWTGTDSNDLWVVDLDRWFRTGEFVKRTIVEGEKARFSGEVSGNTLFMFTTLGAPNGKIVAVDLENPSRANWADLIAERSDMAMESFTLSRSTIAVDYLRNASTRIELFSLAGKPLRTVELPGIGDADIHTSRESDEAFVKYESFNEPPGVYRVDLQSGKRELWARPEAPIDPSMVEVKQVFYTSKDGTKVPMFIVHRKGLKLDGNNPTLLWGYGGFNVSETPAFKATYFPWFEAGGVYAVANLRGGAEYGEAWHRAGMLEKKQNVFDDFIAAAEWLIANRYTSSKRLAVSGGSNGGLLTGAVLTQRPELFGAVISQVPLLDMLRYQHFLMARYWVPEYGTAEDKAQFEFLRKYSPYHNVKPGTKYPAVMLTAGENDARVHPLHARKMAALLQDATGSDQKEKPILLWIDRSAGHGQGKPLELRIRDAADQRIFLMWQLGML